MAKKGARQLIVLVNKATGTRYLTKKNKTNTTDKLILKKYDKKTRKVEEFTETKTSLG
ncbi:50S ribosomal protein L33 [Candidatus Saccharibacteria bacterium]|nr:50S ribosomal protein L33 [Candidatus Saccharibacteria bacterium]